MPALDDLTGKVFRRLTVLHRVKDALDGSARWRCRCDCGLVIERRAKSLKRGSFQSCGCLKAEMSRARKPNLTHGMSKSPEYRAWREMNYRCRSKSAKAWLDYGGRGISVCGRWKTSFKNFFEDMGVRPSGRSLERLDNSKGYSPANCVWASREAQQNNRRTSRYVKHNGRTLSVAQWAKETGIPDSTLRNRIYKNLPVQLLLMPGSLRKGAV